MNEVYAPKSVEVNYRGIRCQVHCTSVLGHYCTLVECCIRSTARDCSRLEALWCEDELVGPRARPEVDVEPVLVEKSRNARLACLQLFPEHSGPSGLLIQAELQKRQKFLRTIDPFFKIETAVFVSCIGDGAERRLKDLILDALPASGKPRSVSDVLSRLEAVGHSKLLAFCSVALKNIFNVVQGYVHNIHCKKPPNFKGTSEAEFNGEVRKGLAFCCSCEVAGSSIAGQETKYSAEALQARFNHLRDRADAEPLSAADLQDFFVFGWLASNEMRAWASKASDAIWAPTSAVPAAEAKPAKKRRTAGERNKADAEELNRDLYS